MKKPFTLDWSDKVNKDGTYLLRFSIEYPKGPYDPILVERLYKKVRNKLVEVIKYETYATDYEIQRENRFASDFELMNAKQVSEMIEKTKKAKYWGAEED